MNRLYLEESGGLYSIPRSDRRYTHILRVLKKKAGDSLEAGRSDGALGTAYIESIDQDTLVLRFEVSGEAPLPLPVRLLMGFPRPIQAGRILKDLTSLGAASVWFALSELGEKSYAESNFFKDQEYKGFLIEGAEQCGNPRLPEVRTFWSLGRALEALVSLEGTSTDGATAKGPRRIGFHPGLGLPSLADLSCPALPLTLALGSERGWTRTELDALEKRGFLLCSLGPRILKTETAAVAALSIALSRLGSM
ncbi:MAG: RsmE family RNA methyltransferase [Spirochaetes bacterium]|nr:RsmE family RNA methyltransferase [Spirochaetota bacterium]